MDFAKYRHSVRSIDSLLAMAPKQSRHDGGADLWLRQQLAEIKQVPLEQVGRIRMTPEKLPSLVDVGVILTGKAPRHVADDLAAIMRKHPDLSEKVGQIKFGGRGNHNTPVPKDLAGLIEIIFLLPGRAAAQVRRAAAQVFVRYLGGDLSLIGEVEHLNHVQSFLRENAPDHPLRHFGEAVEGHGASPEEDSAARELKLQHQKRMLELEFEEKQCELQAKKVRIAAEEEKLKAENAAALEKLKAENAAALEKLKAENAAAAEKRKAEVQRQQDETHEEFRRQRASTIMANLEALRMLRPDAPLSPRSQRVVEDELRTGLMGQERPDAALGRPVYCSRYLQEKLFLKEWAARERAKVFGNDVKTAVRRRFPDYNLEARTNRSVDGHEREAHLYFEAHLPAFDEALPLYVARAVPVRDEELTVEGLRRKRARQEQGLRSFVQRL